MDWIWIACGVAAAMVGLWGVWTFNRLVRRRTLVEEGWSNIDVQLRRRAELIPNLVELVKGYSDYEKRVLENVTRLRTEGQQATDLRQRESSENALTDQIKGLFAVAERYPDLKADRNFLGLQKQLSDIEDQIQMARRYYNGATRNYNILSTVFPPNVVAGVFGFGGAEFFQIETATERHAPDVEMD